MAIVGPSFFFLPEEKERLKVGGKEEKGKEKDEEWDNVVWKQIGAI